MTLPPHLFRAIARLWLTTRDPYELVSSRVAATLIREGYRASALKGGINDWLTAKYPTDAKDAPKQKPPTAGALKG